MERFRVAFIGVGISFSTLVLYLITAYPTVAYIDSGELAVVNWTLGIAHPTGYPLYTLIGRLFALLPFELIKTQILFGAFCTSAAVAVLSVSLIRVLQVRGLAQQLAMAVAGILIGVAPLVWSQGVTNEVYSLHLLMLVLIVTLLIKNYSPNNFILGAFVVGLSFGNHMSTVLLVPAIVYYAFINRARLKNSPQIVLMAIGIAALAATLYLYLPIRSAQDPIFNWGQPTSLGNFVRHVSGWQYQVWMFSRTTDELIRSLGNFTIILFNQFPPPFWLIVIYGVRACWRKQRRITILLALLFAFNILYSLNFNIPDIDNYLLPSVLVLFVYSVIGIAAIAANSLARAKIVTAVVVAMVVWGVAANWSENDQSENTSAIDGVHNYYASADSGSLVLCADWDFVSPWLYSHFYLKEHSDIILVDNELARRSWYPDWIRHTDYQLYEYIKPAAEAFLPHVRQFESGVRYDPRRIEQTYRDLLMKIMQYPNHKLYYDQSVQLSIEPPGQTTVTGQLFRVVRQGELMDNSRRSTIPPNFGKPEDSYNRREKQHLKFYNLMVENGKGAAGPAPK